MVSRRGAQGGPGRLLGAVCPVLPSWGCPTGGQSPPTGVSLVPRFRCKMGGQHCLSRQWRRTVTTLDASQQVRLTKGLSWDLRDRNLACSGVLCVPRTVAAQASQVPLPLSGEAARPRAWGLIE